MRISLLFRPLQVNLRSKEWIAGNAEVVYGHNFLYSAEMAEFQCV
jgi:hypothetical protein